VHLDTLPRDAAAYGRHHTDLPGAGPLDLAVYPVPRPLGPTPRTIREHVGARQFGPFGSILLTTNSTADRLQAAVARYRARDAALSRSRKRESVAAPLIAFHKAAGRKANRLTDFATIIVILALLLWVGVPVALAAVAGQL
jgi:hypothetical protein